MSPFTIQVCENQQRLINSFKGKIMSTNDRFASVGQDGYVTAEDVLFLRKNVYQNHELDQAEINSLPVSYTHLRAHETREDLVCRLLLEKKKI